MFKMSSVVIALAMLVCFAFTSNVRAEVSAKDKEFAKNAAMGGTMEVGLGKFVTENATDPDVKKFAQQMVDDHSKANDELKNLAQSKGLDLKEGMDKGDEMVKDKTEKLSKLNGNAFDLAYMNDMVDDHEKDIREFQEASKNADDKDLKKWADDKVDTLKHHLKMANDTREKLRKSNG